VLVLAASCRQFRVFSLDPAVQLAAKERSAAKSFVKIAERLARTLAPPGICVSACPPEFVPIRVSVFAVLNRRKRRKQSRDADLRFLRFLL
jgi:hypothetical protein